MTETGKVFLRYLYKRFWWKVIHHRKKLFRIIHKRAFETSMKKLKFVIFTNAPCKGLNSNQAIFRNIKSWWRWQKDYGKYDKIGGEKELCGGDKCKVYTYREQL